MGMCACLVAWVKLGKISSVFVLALLLLLIRENEDRFG